ncbi:MAG TPA: lamin tail domain-containing protein [Pyrinomonadaceae bacterium]|nr:lamin tail domain-containing protein [Pyrinomonadaceae bacterium]
MLKLARCSFACAAMIALLVVAAEGTVRAAGQNVAGPANKSIKAKKSTKKTKKTKKRAQVVIPLTVMISPQSVVQPAVAPVASPIEPSVGELPVPTAPAIGRQTLSASRSSGGVRILPTGRPGGEATVATAGQLVISEFRVRGPSGAQDEFIEIYNASGADHTVAAASGTGYGIAASDGVTRCSIPNGTVIPNRGHYLCANSAAYSLAGYAVADATYTTDIPDNAGIALFNNNTGGGSYILANRLDAVGSTSEANTLYKEGTGYPALTPFSIDYSFYRDNCGKGGSITTFGACPSGGLPVDTDNNAANFVFVDTNGTSAGAGQRLGAPGPENLSSPIQRNANFAANLLDATVAAANPPNRVRDFTSDPANNSTFGTLSIRRRWVNQTGGNVTRLRFRIVDQTTFPAPSGFADLRARTSVAVVVAGINDSATCAATGAPATPPCTATVQGTTLEQPPTQPNGSAFNGSLSAGTVTIGTPLANGASINLQFLLGIQQTGSFKIFVNVEALP